MNCTNFIKNHIDYFNRDLKELKEVMISQHAFLEEGKFPTVTRLEETLDKVARLAQVIAKSSLKLEDEAEALRGIQYRYERLYEWTLNRKIEDLEEKKLIWTKKLQQIEAKVVPPLEEEAVLTQILPKKLAKLLVRITLLSKSPYLSEVQTERLNLIKGEVTASMSQAKALRADLKQLLQQEVKEEMVFDKRNLPSLERRLPQEVLGHICHYLSSRDLIRLGKCSQFFNKFINDERFWVSLLKKKYPLIALREGENARQKYVDLKRQGLDQGIKNGFYTVHNLKQHEEGVDYFQIIGDLLISGFCDGTIKIYDLEAQEFLTTLTFTKARRINSILSPFFSNFFLSVHNSFQIKDGLLYASTSNTRQKKIQIWSLATKETVASLKGHEKYISHMQIAGNCLYSASWDKTIRVWDLHTRKCVAILRGHMGPIYSLQISDKSLYSISLDKTIKVWDLEERQCMATASIVGNTIDSVPWSLQVVNDRLYVGLSYGEIQEWDRHSMQCKQMVQANGQDAPVSCLAVKDSFLFSGSYDVSSHKKHGIRILGPSLKPLIELSGHSQEDFGVRSMAIRGRQLYSASRNGPIKVWNFSKTALEFLSKISREPRECFERLPLKIQNKISEEMYLDLAFNHDWSASTSEERSLAISRYLLKKIIKALRVGKTARALSLFPLLPEGLKKNLFKDSEEIFSESMKSEIQNYLKKTKAVQYVQIFEREDGEEFYNLGRRYAKGVVPNYIKALKWYELAASKGHVGAMCSIGYIYSNHLGEKSDHKEALKWYQLAADRGSSVAMYNIGLLHLKGQGVKRSYEEAVNWLGKSAKNGHAKAQALLIELLVGQKKSN